MDIQFYGANCISVSNKHVRIIVDDNLEDLGGKSITKDDDIVLFTGAHGTPKVKTHLAIDHPGEYEVSEVSIYGIPLRSHMDEKGKKSTTAYKVIVDDLRFLFIGHAYPELSERELEAIGTVDVMFVPVGGHGYTSDPIGALKMVKKVEPKLVIPTHYDAKGLQYPVPQLALAQVLTELTMEPKETTDKLKLKSTDLTEGTQLIVLNPA
jgi:L-ascorbate metabolism protein UlaG (beta-lactamase superfamily)